MSLVTESPVLTTTCVSTGVARHRVTCVDDLSLSVLSSEPRFALATKRKYGLLSAQRWERVESTDVTQSWECTGVRACISNQRINSPATLSLLNIPKVPLRFPSRSSCRDVIGSPPGKPFIYTQPFALPLTTYTSRMYTLVITEGNGIVFR